MPRTLFDKIWDAHEVAESLLYIDLHLVHEVTSAAGLRRPAPRRARRPPARPHAGHGRPQRAHRRHAGRGAHPRRAQPRAGADARAQLRGVRHPDLLAGLRPPGHRPRHRARARRHPAGDDDRLRRQPHRHPRRLRRAGLRHRHERGRARARHPVPGPAQAQGRCASATRASSGFGVTAKDLILGTIGQMGVDGAVGHVVEYAGPAIEALSMEGRMTVCNMTIEGGGRAGMVAPDETTSRGSTSTAPTSIPPGASCTPTTARASIARSSSTPAR